MSSNPLFFWLLLAVSVRAPFTCAVSLDGAPLDTSSETGEANTDCLETGDCMEAPILSAVCGDGVIEDQEQCDGGECCEGCIFRPSNYVCAVDLMTQYGCPWGSMENSDVGSRSRGRLCSGSSAECNGDLDEWGEWETVEPCDGYYGCIADEFVCGCVTSYWWWPSIMSDQDSEGTQYFNGQPVALATTSVGIELSPSAEPGHLLIRICKIDANIPDVQNTTSVYFVRNDDVILFSGELAASGGPCSVTAEISNEEDLLEGMVLNGAWRVVSPSTSAPEWTYDCQKAIVGDPTGTCWWSAATQGVERTCVLP